MTDVERALIKFIKEDKTDFPLIIEEDKIPNTAFLHNSIQADNRTYFFGSEDNRVDFDLISSVYLMDYQFKHPTETFGDKNPFSANFDIPALLGNDGILFKKEGETLFRLSLDEKNPCFQEINLKTRDIQLMDLDKAKEIVSSWLKDDKETAETVSKKLEKIYNKIPRSRLIKPKNKKILPHFSDVYRYFGLKDCFNRGSKQLTLVSNNFPIPPVLTKNKKLIFKKNNIYYKIDFNDGISFERVSDLGHFLMTRNDMTFMLNEIKKHNLFHEKTNAVCSALNVVYRQNVEHLFTGKRNDQIPASPLKRPNEHNLYLLKKGTEKTA